MTNEQMAEAFGEAMVEYVAKYAKPLFERVAELENRAAELEDRLKLINQCRFVGVWQRYVVYDRGNFVSRAGSVWHCNEDETVDIEPGLDPKKWTLAVKAGQDLRDKSK